jgi:hypothetical protein
MNQLFCCFRMLWNSFLCFLFCMFASPSLVMRICALVNDFPFQFLWSLHFFLYTLKLYPLVQPLSDTFLAKPAHRRADWQWQLELERMHQYTQRFYLK